MTLKLDQDPALELPLDPEEAEEDFSPDDGDDDDDDEDEDEETDSEGEGDDYGGAGNGRVKPPLKKGPWTPEEDRRLKEYVEAHGEGNWNQVQRNAGLNRCGKSCRLRWANHLRPDLKKGPFDPDEVDLILKLHIKWGNKWAKMAAHLPGRTDNEIKNFWNTRSKRHQRAGLPIYPDHLLSQAPDEDINCDMPDESRGRKRSNDSSQEKVLAMSDLIDECIHFQHLDYGKDPLVLEKQLKRYASTGNLPSVQIPGGSEKNFLSTDLNNLLPKSQSVPLGSAIASGYPIFNGNPSTSGSVHRSTKTELPSFQCSGYGLSNDWLLQCHSVPLIEQQIDPFTQSQESISSQNAGLLGAIVHKSDVLYDPTKSEGLFEMQVPSTYNLVSQSNAYPMRHPSSLVLGDYEPEGCPSAEIQASDSPSGSDPIYPVGTCFPDGVMPDMSLDASLLNDPLYHLGSLFYEDSCGEPKPFTDAGQWPDSSAWKNMPGACPKP